MSEARKMILEMVKEGRITTDEALSLLDAIEEGGGRAAAQAHGARFNISPFAGRGGGRGRRFWVERMAETPHHGGPPRRRGMMRFALARDGVPQHVADMLRHLHPDPD